jgi:hypothetical protein
MATPATRKPATAIHFGTQRWSGSGQCTDYRGLVTYVDKHSVEHKLRILIHTDSYVSQMYAKVERWDGTKWNNVVFMDGDELTVSPTIGYAKSNMTRPDYESKYSTDVARLLALATEVLE